MLSCLDLWFLRALNNPSDIEGIGSLSRILLKDLFLYLFLNFSSIVDISEVTHSNYHVIDCQTAGGEPIKITWNHPVLAKSGSVWAFEYTGDIDTSYKLLSSSLEEVSINSITPTTSSLITRRFDVEPQDTYFAGEILVHN